MPIKVNDDHILQQKLANELAKIINLEQQLIKVYQKLEKAAFTDELVKCLSPVSTDSLQHLQRVKLIKSTIRQKPKDIEKFDLKINTKLKKPHLAQDLDIINFALAFQNLKLGIYEFLHPLAVSLKLEIEANLIEQTITDNRNTNIWLRQIIQNIVSPALLVHT